jgi:hypothetical protein
MLHRVQQGLAPDLATCAALAIIGGADFRVEAVDRGLPSQAPFDIAIDLRQRPEVRLERVPARLRDWHALATLKEGLGLLDPQLALEPCQSLSLAFGGQVDRVELCGP